MNSEFIDCILTETGLNDTFSRVDTNPAKFNAGGRLTIEYYHNKDCDLSTVNLCKGQIVVDHIEKREREGTQYKCVVQVGDGINDFCPAL